MGTFSQSQLGFEGEVGRRFNPARHLVRLSEDIIFPSARDPFPSNHFIPLSFSLWFDNKTKRGCLLPLARRLAGMSGQRRNLVLARYRSPVSHSLGNEED